MELPPGTEDRWKGIGRLARNKATVEFAVEACVRLLQEQPSVADRIAIRLAWNRIRGKVHDRWPPWETLAVGIPWDQARKELLLLANSRDKEVSAAALQVLQVCASADDVETLAPPLVSLLKDPNQVVRGSASAILGRFAETAPDQMEPILEALWASKPPTHKMEAFSLAATRAGRAHLDAHLERAWDLLQGAPRGRQRTVVGMVWRFSQLPSPDVDEVRLLASWLKRIHESANLHRDTRLEAAEAAYELFRSYRRKGVDIARLQPLVERFALQLPPEDLLVWTQPMIYQQWSSLLQGAGASELAQATERVGNDVAAYRNRMQRLHEEDLKRRLAKQNESVEDETDLLRSLNERLNQMTEDLERRASSLPTEASEMQARIENARTLEAFADALVAIGYPEQAALAYQKALGHVEPVTKSQMAKEVGLWDPSKALRKKLRDLTGG